MLRMGWIESAKLNLFEAFVNACDRAAAGRRKEAAHLETGRRGERAAYFYLRRRRFVVVARGWRSGIVRGDLDLIAWEGDTLCFIEVKTRTTRAVATAEASVDEDKRRNLRRLARHYLRQLPDRDRNAGDVPVRFDILSIYFEEGKSPDFDLFRAAFGWG
jgi:putative endonuclease